MHRRGSRHPMADAPVVPKRNAHRRHKKPGRQFLAPGEYLAANGYKRDRPSMLQSMPGIAQSCQSGTFSELKICRNAAPYWREKPGRRNPAPGIQLTASATNATVRACFNLCPDLRKPVNPEPFLNSICCSYASQIQAHPYFPLQCRAQ